MKEDKEQLENDDLEEKNDENKKSEEVENIEEKKEEITDEKLEKIKDELENNKTKKKKDKNTKDIKLSKSISRNILIGIVISIYFLFIALGVKTIPITEYMMDLKTFAMFIIIIAIVIFEKAYKKDENYLALHGIEMVVLGIETLVLLNLYSLENGNFEYILYGITGAMFTYYMVKSIVILIKAKIKKHKS